MTAPAKTRERVPELDLMRFCAAAGVVVFHFRDQPPAGSSLARWLDALSHYGFMGVPLFFMISGFVVLWTATGRSPASFLAARFSRLYPSYWVCVTLTTLTIFAAGGHIPLATYLANLTMFQPLLRRSHIDPVYWTLFVELKFYGLMLLVLLAGQLGHIVRWLAVWLALAAVSVASHYGALPVIPRLDVVALDGTPAFFVSGCLAYLIRQQGPSPRYLAMYVASMVVGAAAESRLQAVYTQTMDARTIGIVIAFVVAFHALMLAVALRQLRLPSSRAWYWLGSLTYPLYLIHAVAGKTLYREILPATLAPGLKLLVVLAAVMAVTVLLAVTIEQRGCAAFNRLLTGAWNRRAAPARGAAVQE